MNKELRKQQNLLVDAGVGVILFAVWSVAKVNLYLGLSPFLLEEVSEVAEFFGLNDILFLAFMITVVVGVLLFQLGVRLYIGLRATAEGKGKNKGYGYLIVTAVLLITDFQTNWQTLGVERILAGEGMTVNLITCVCMEAASLYVLMELLISGIRVKIMRKKMKE